MPLKKINMSKYAFFSSLSFATIAVSTDAIFSILTLFLHEFCVLMCWIQKIPKNNVLWHVYIHTGGQKISGSQFRHGFSYSEYSLLAKDYIYFIILGVYWSSKKFKWICAGPRTLTFLLCAHSMYVISLSTDITMG